MQRLGHAARLVLLSTSWLPPQQLSQNQFPKTELSGGYPHDIVRKAMATTNGRPS